MFDLIEENSEVVLNQALYSHDNDVSVKLRYSDGEWAIVGCRWPSQWGDKERGGYGVPQGESLSHEEIESRRQEARRAASELIAEQRDG